MKIAKLALLCTRNERNLLTEVIAETYHVGCEEGYFNCWRLANAEFNRRHQSSLVQAEGGKLQPFKANYLLEEGIVKDFDQSLMSHPAHSHGIRIPEDIQKIRSFYLEGKYAILENLPHPPVLDDVPGHAYLRITDCLRDAFALGIPIETIPPVAAAPVNTSLPVVHSKYSARARQILDNLPPTVGGGPEQCVVTFFEFWNDDFEPNSFSKVGRGSAWIKTMTIAAPGEFGNIVHHTYPIAVGKKGDSHNGVEEKIRQELAILRTGQLAPVYVGGIKKFASIRCDLFAALQDQPERRSSNCLALGNGTHSARWLYSCNHAELYPRIRACRKCYASMKQRLRDGQWNLPLDDCPDCLNWNILKDSPLALCQPPKDYPVTFLPQHRNADRTTAATPAGSVSGGRLLCPFQISYAGLKRAVKVAHDHITAEQWTTANCEAYLRVECLNADAIHSIMEHARRALAYLKVLQDPNQDPEAAAIIRREQEANPSRYQMWKFPAVWDREGVEMVVNIDSIMHLLFLGIVKSSVLIIQEWLVSMRKNDSFIRNNAKHLEHLADMSIDWLRVIKYTGGKLGGWVSENYLGFARVCQWFYQNIGEAMPAPDDSIPPPHLPQDKWLVRHNRGWLKARGLDTSGKAEDLSKRVASFMRQDPVPEPKPQKEKRATDLDELLSSLHGMIATFMQPAVGEGDVQKAEHQTRVFLNAFDDVDATLRDDDAKTQPVVVGKYNFPCLLNLPATMALHGPLRNLWEGGFKGEGFLRTVKPSLSQGFRTKWANNLLRNLLRHRSLCYLLDGPMERHEVCMDTYLKDNSTKLHKHESAYKVHSIVAEKAKVHKRPLSVVLVRPDPTGTTRMMVVVKDYDTVVELSLHNGVPPLHKFGMFYFRVEYKGWVSTHGNDSGCSWKKDVVPTLTNPSVQHAVLLPKLDSGDDSSSCFAIVSSNWKVLEVGKGLDSLF
jgi:hypothetical protein